MKCPSCSGALTTIDYEGIKIETCNNCQGEWLDADELKHIVRTREIHFDPQERQAIAQATKITGVPLDDEDRDLNCPKCGGQTDAVNYGGDSGIIIDRCTSCGGIWLDAGELEHIQMVVEGWKDGLKGDLAKYSPRLHQIAGKLDQDDDVRVSRVGFINVLMNGILDII